MNGRLAVAWLRRKFLAGFTHDPDSYRRAHLFLDGADGELIEEKKAADLAVIAEVGGEVV